MLTSPMVQLVKYDLPPRAVHESGWTLSPGEVRRLEAKIGRLAGKLERINQRLVELQDGPTV